jgi:hypothetical protein
LIPRSNCYQYFSNDDVSIDDASIDDAVAVADQFRSSLLFLLFYPEP